MLSKIATLIRMVKISEADILVCVALLMGIMGFSIPRLFPVMAVSIFIFVLYILWRMPETVIRLFLRTLIHTVYRLRREGMDQIPEKGPAILVCNHVTYLDALFITAVCQRPARFVMHAPIYRLPVIHTFCRFARVIPIASRREEPTTLRNALAEIAQALRNGELVCVFPEGKLTRDGQLQPFRPGVEKIVKKTPVPVIPMALKGLWGSFFSHKDGTAFIKWPQRIGLEITVVAGQPIMPQFAQTRNLFERVRELSAI